MFPREAARHAASMRLFLPSMMFHNAMETSFLVERVPTSPLPTVFGVSLVVCDCDPPPRARWSALLEAAVCCLVYDGPNRLANCAEGVAKGPSCPFCWVPDEGCATFCPPALCVPTPPYPPSIPRSPR